MYVSLLCGYTTHMGSGHESCGMGWFFASIQQNHFEFGPTVRNVCCQGLTNKVGCLS